MNLTKLPGWETRLQSYFVEHMRHCFDRGVFDCVRFTSGAVFQVVGIELADSFVSKYRNDEEAKELLRSFGEDGFYKVVSQVLTEAGFVEINWMQAHRGDPVFIATLPGETDDWCGGLGVCAGTHAMTPGRKGLLSVPMRRTRCAWRVPYV